MATKVGQYAVAPYREGRRTYSYDEAIARLFAALLVVSAEDVIKGGAAADEAREFLESDFAHRLFGHLGMVALSPDDIDMNHSRAKTPNPVKSAEKPGYYTVPQLADLAGCHDYTVRNAIKCGALAGEKSGRFWLVQKDVGEAWVAKRWA
jgi:hypothetical protein